LTIFNNREKAALVLLKLLSNGNEKYHFIDTPYSIVNRIKVMIPKEQK